MTHNLSPEALALARIRELCAEYGSALTVPINRLNAILDDWERDEEACRDNAR